MEDKKQSETEKPPCANYFARPQGEGWLPPAEAENAVNVALRLSGGAVSACLPMLLQIKAEIRNGQPFHSAFRLPPGLLPV
ncbi:MAG: hypothetical protein KIC46_09395 [Clostridiales bacterium]|nr:hypothetical protein [Clostridiales bacterium]